mmetsp:Transcript_15073/g.22721  ORF Transcript_15073/g.22721 Transcript_15073/m.22721 type:complete len:100 (+) Transcript_15073:971-1270(+)|eukprot:scaffold2014_cov125-Skeletonema_dohrnii-CCMP3373.AAC.1
MAPFHGPLVFGEFVDGAIGADLADNVIAVGVSARGGEDEWVGGEGAAEGVEGLAGGDYEGRFLLQVEQCWRAGRCGGGGGGAIIKHCSRARGGGSGNTH